MRPTALILPGIFLLLFTLHAPATVRYVDLNCTNATPPFTDWTTAATNIQDAVDVAVDGDLVLVTNGVYQSGARLTSDGITNRVVVTNAVTIQSVNGWPMTAIDGAHSMRGLYLADGAVLSGFAVTNGSVVGKPGGGVYCNSTNASVFNCLVISNSSAFGGGIINGTVSNCIVSCNRSSSNGGGTESCMLSKCILTNNSAGGRGGGASSGTVSVLNDCFLFGNSATSHAGGAYGCTLNSCLVVSNKCPNGSGGAASDCVLNNCTVVGNSALINSGVEIVNGAGLSPAARNCIIYYNFPGNIAVPTTNCCSTLATGVGNFTNAPLFVNLPIADFHLQSNSPCINAGNNSYITTTTDLDGNQRISGGTVDIGAYEFQSPSSILSYAWAQQYGLPTDGTADAADPDSDGLNNWQEWIAGTVPTNSLSVLKMFSPSNNAPGVKVSWQSVSGKSYFLQRSTNLFVQPAFTSIQSNLVGAANSTAYSDTTATNGGPYFYRIGVQP